MNRTTLGIGAVVVIIIGVVLALMPGDKSDDNSNVVVENTPTPTTAIIIDSETNTPTPTVVVDQTMTGMYVEYSEQAFSDYSSSDRVLFFHAQWCPDCRVADKDLTSNTNLLPENVVVYKTDYDSESTLKSKYNITYQHTFVHVDANGNEISKWSGGGAQEIADNI